MTDNLTPGETCDGWRMSRPNPGTRCKNRHSLHAVGSTLHLCDWHLQIALRHFSDLLGGINAQLLRQARAELAAAERALDDADYARKRKAAKAREERRRRGDDRQVYFIRCESFVKIGVSADPEKRLVNIQRSGNGTLAPRIDLTTSHIAATEPGGQPRERELHDRFASLRVVGEWFEESDELRTYIDNLPISFPSLTTRRAA